MLPIFSIAKNAPTYANRIEGVFLSVEIRSWYWPRGRKVEESWYPALTRWAKLCCAYGACAARAQLAGVGLDRLSSVMYI